MTTYRYREHPSTLPLRLAYIDALYRKVGALPRVLKAVARALCVWHALAWLMAYYATLAESEAA